MADLKFCKDCIHYSDPETCNHPRSEIDNYHPVTGEKFDKPRTALSQRAYRSFGAEIIFTRPDTEKHQCGKEAFWYEPKP